MNESYNTIKNVVFTGHSGSGKTSLVETMLFESGMIPKRGSVVDKNTVSDYTNIEKEKEHSIFSSSQHLIWKDSKINLIDTPGLDDFVGELLSAIKVADTALVTVAADQGVEVGTDLAWEYLDRQKIPSFFVITKMDHPKANYEESLKSIQAHFGSKVLPFQFPVEQGAGFNRIVDALRMVMYVFPEGGGKPEKQDISEEHLGRAQEMHNAIVEAAAEHDDGLLEKFFDAGTLNEEELAQGLSIALKEHEVYPVFICSAEQNMGTGRIMGFIHDIAPLPEEFQNQSTSDPTRIFIYKTITEPQVGRVYHFKVMSGELKAGNDLSNLRDRSSERINQIFVVNGRQRDALSKLGAGEIGACIKLKNTQINDTLASGDSEVVEPIAFPDSRVRNAIHVNSQTDYDKVFAALHNIATEDPTILIEPSQELNQTIVHGQGRMHLDLIKYRIEKVNKLHFDWIRPKIPFRETITIPSESTYRHKKQSGGSGQFGEITMKIEPYKEGQGLSHNQQVRHSELIELPWGGHLFFNWCIIGGAIDTRYQSAIKKGLIEQLRVGPVLGYPTIDVTVSILDGKMHSVDSNDAAFMAAAKGALKSALEANHNIVLEPYYDLSVKADGDIIGDVMSDLQSRRAIIQGMDSMGNKQVIRAEVPYLEMGDYSSNLRSMSHGKAKFERRFSDYKPAEGNNLEKIRSFINQYQEG
mgnify:CR=1 FL=1